MTEIKQLRERAIAVSKNSYSIYSNAKLGSAVLAESGKIYSGCNVENSSYGATVCAERVAIWNAIANGEKKIVKIYIYSQDGWPPCGMCRQVMSEFGDSEMEIIIGNAKGEEKIYRLKDIFPLAFTPDHLNK